MKKRDFLFILFFLLAAVYNSYSQNINISWEGGENALHYKVEIERETDNGFAPYLTETTAEKYFYLSLPKGKFCYRIIPYDILERPSEATKWIYFEVKSLEDVLILRHSGTAEKKERKTRNFITNIGAAYMPLIPVFGSDELEAEFIGTSLRVSINFPLSSYTFIGPEASVLWSNGMVNTGLNVRLLRLLEEKDLGFVFRLGTEYAFLYNDMGLDSPFNLMSGFSFVCQITPIVNIELGFDLVSPMSMPPDGFIRPLLGVGVKF